MGYATRPEIVEENAELLTRIKAAIDNGKSIKFRVLENAQISREQYRLRRILAATDNHPMAFGGAFARLGSRTTLKVDAREGVVIASPRVSSPFLEEYRANERDALSLLDEAKGSMLVLEFYPSETFSLPTFEKAALERGWQVYPEAASTTEGKLTLPAERSEKPSETDNDLSKWLRE